MIANLRSSHLHRNLIFKKNSRLNRDDIFDPYIQLKNSFEFRNILLNTPDINLGKKIDFEVHMDFQDDSNSDLNYLILFENPEIYYSNKIENLFKYRKIFTWNDNFVDNKKFFKIYFPNKIKKIKKFKNYDQRSKFLSIIASHRTLPNSIKNNLYKERLDAICWFKKNHPDDLCLYGSGWDSSILPHFLNKRPMRFIFENLYRLMNSHRFNFYKGTVKSKKSILDNSKFSLCYENLSGLNGYVTEKIFDCFLSGCIPIYLGASNIEKYIPSDCFINRNNFMNNESLYQYIKTINRDDFLNYQERIKNYLNSSAAHKFSSICFAKTITNHILNDFKK